MRSFSRRSWAEKSRSFPACPLFGAKWSFLCILRKSLSIPFLCFFWYYWIKQRKRPALHDDDSFQCASLLLPFSPWKPPDWRIGGLSGFFAFSLKNMEKALLPMPYLYLYAFSKNIVHELCRIVYSFSAFILLWCSHKRKAKTAGLLHYQSMFIIVFSSPLFPKVPWVMTDDPGYFWICGKIWSFHTGSPAPLCVFPTWWYKLINI